VKSPNNKDNPALGGVTLMALKSYRKTHRAVLKRAKYNCSVRKRGENDQRAGEWLINMRLGAPSFANRPVCLEQTGMIGYSRYFEKFWFIPTVTDN
jgi:hypothetical protein